MTKALFQKPCKVNIMLKKTAPSSCSIMFDVKVRETSWCSVNAEFFSKAVVSDSVITIFLQGYPR